MKAQQAKTRAQLLSKIHESGSLHSNFTSDTHTSLHIIENPPSVGSVKSSNISRNLNATTQRGVTIKNGVLTATNALDEDTIDLNSYAPTVTKVTNKIRRRNNFR